MSEQIIEIVNGHGWYKDKVGSRFPATANPSLARGQAKWEINEEPAFLFDGETEV